VSVNVLFLVWKRGVGGGGRMFVLGGSRFGAALLLSFPPLCPQSLTPTHCASHRTSAAMRWSGLSTLLPACRR
jgi:hypothetical protein